MQVVSADSVKAEDLGSRDVVVINDVQKLSDQVKDRLNELVRKTGQGQIVILGGNADLNWWYSFASLPVKVTQKIFVAKDRGKDSFSLTTYDRNHSIFKPFERSSTLTLASAQFFAYVETEPKKGASVLAKFENGSPVMVESPSDDRGMLVLTSPMDGIANDLPMKPVFLPLFHEMVNYLSRYSETRGWYTMGEAIPVSGSVSASSAAVINPKGERIALGDLAAGAQKFFTPEISGFHEIRVGPDVEIVAVKPPAAESNLDRMPPEDLVASVRRSPGDSQQAAFAGDDAKADYARRQTGWWYLLLVALLAGIGRL